MGGLGHGRLTRRPGLLVLALAALWIQALIPAGYMISPDQGPGLVICTGHGPLTGQNRHPDGAPSANHDGVCLFAGHGLAVAPPLLARLPTRQIIVHSPTITVSVAQTPGRGLAAPPPPSHAPPELT